MDTSSIVGWSGLVLSILGIIYSAVNHRHVRLRICNHLYDFSIDVNTTEEEEKKKKEEEKKKEEDERKKKEE